MARSFSHRGKPKRGLYKPQNPEKYIQPKDNYMNSKEYPEYRSSWELHAYRYFDMSPAVKFWSTEYIAIPYTSPIDGKTHRYFPDCFVIFNTGKKVIIEIKPHKEVYINENKRITQKMKETYLINRAKWEAAKEVALENTFEFLIMDEYDLGIEKRK